MIPSYSSPMASLNQYMPDWNTPRSGLLGMVDTSPNVAPPIARPVTAQADFKPSFMQGLTGYTDQEGIKTDGWGGLALGAASALGGAFMGMKQYGMAKQQLSESKRQFDMNYGAQRQTINTELEDRQRARVASNPSAYQSVGDYMNQNKVR